MPVFEIVPEHPSDPTLVRVFDKVRGFGMPEIPNLYRTIGLAPKMLAAWVEFAWTLRLQAKTPRALRELMILRSAQVSGTDYEWVHHVPMALAAGVPQAQIDDLAEWSTSDSFDATERAAIDVAEQITRGPGASPAAMRELARRFAPEETMELVLTVALYPCVSRIIYSMGVEIEEPYLQYLPANGKAP